MFSDKAKPISGAPKRCSTEKGCDLTHKHLTGLERLARDKCSSLLWKGITDARKKFYNIGHWSVWLFQAHVDPEELFRKIFGEFSRGFRNSGRGGFQDIFEDFSPFGFGFGAQETVVNLTFQQAARGVTKEIEIIQATGTARLPSLTMDKLKLTGPNVIKLFMSVIYDCLFARVLVTGKQAFPI